MYARVLSEAPPDSLALILVSAGEAILVCTDLARRPAVHILPAAVRAFDRIIFRTIVVPTVLATIIAQVIWARHMPGAITYRTI